MWLNFFNIYIHIRNLADFFFERERERERILLPNIPFYFLFFTFLAKFRTKKTLTGTEKKIKEKKIKVHDIVYVL